MGCAERLGQSELIVGNVNGRHFKAHVYGNLNRQMPKAADAEDRQPLPALRLGLHNGAIDGHAGTEKRRGLNRRHGVGNSRRVAGRRFHKFRIASIHGQAGNFLF